MGRSTTPTFVVDYQDQLGWHRVAWDSKTSGRPTNTNLEAWRVAMNKSMNPGGCNEHVSKSVGFILHISKAAIHNQTVSAGPLERQGRSLGRVHGPVLHPQLLRLVGTGDGIGGRQGLAGRRMGQVEAPCSA